MQFILNAISRFNQNLIPMHNQRRTGPNPFFILIQCAKINSETHTGSENEIPDTCSSGLKQLLCVLPRSSPHEKQSGEPVSLTGTAPRGLQGVSRNRGTPRPVFSEEIVYCQRQKQKKCTYQSATTIIIDTYKCVVKIWNLLFIILFCR